MNNDFLYIYIFVLLKWLETALWCTIHEVIPDMRIQGCHFHWSQAIWHKVQDMDLAVAFMEDAKTHKFICCLFRSPSYQQNKSSLYLQPSLPLTPLLSRYHWLNFEHMGTRTVPSDLQRAGLWLTAESEQIMAVRTDDWTQKSTDTTCHSTS